MKSLYAEIDAGYKRLRDFARGAGARLPTDMRNQYKDKGGRLIPINQWLNQRQVIDAVRKLVTYLEGLAKGDSVEIDLEECTRSDAISENYPTSAVDITVNPTKHISEKHMAESIFHELLHRYGGVGEDYSIMDYNRDGKFGGPSGLGIDENDLNKKDYAQKIVEQFWQ